MSELKAAGERPLWLDSVAIALLLTATLKIMANATISPALPSLQAAFPDNPNAAYLTRFLVSAPSLTVVLVAPFAGLATDRYGRGRLLVAGIALFAVSGSAGAYLPGLSSILFSRFALGFAVALVMTAQVALVGDLFFGPRRGTFLGWQTAAINFSGFLYIGAAGLLAGVSPRLPFLVYALPVLLLPLLVTLVRREDSSPEPIGPVADGADTGADRKRWLVASLAVGALAMATVMLFFLMPSQLPFYLHENGFDAAKGTAAGLGALTLTGGAFALAFKRVSARLGVFAAYGLGLVLMSAGFLVLAIKPVWLLILPGAALVGAGYAFVQPGFLMLALQVAPPERRGTVSGIVTTSMFLGQVVSPLLLTPVIQSLGFAMVYRAAAVTLTLFAAGCFVPVLLRRIRQKETAERGMEV
ncbi:MFS transporter [Roseibium aggregatum]|uniref:MFS transporter n=1 Tax=Roseibium aggregatum TaxID=187304 RepID=A0A939EBW0_9HYPH|nr:MFS transporter [Roseibium aggregatum]MBN9670325.1 MFS transporter [Roseibium aggregatum]